MAEHALPLVAFAFECHVALRNENMGLFARSANFLFVSPRCCSAVDT